MSRRHFVVLCCAAFAVLHPHMAFAAATDAIQAQIDANTQQLLSLQSKILEYQQKLNAIGVEKNTLQQAISALTLTQQKLTTEIQATQNKISSANLQIQKLTNSISDKEETIANDQAAIAKALRRIGQDETNSLVARVISSDSLSQAWQAADQAAQFNRALGEDIAELRSVRATLEANRADVRKAKETLVSLENDLSNQKRSVTATKSAQQELLAQTKNQESNYQKLLAAAKAELQSFSAFTQNAGGSKLLNNQTVCDAWGCYYSQRDTLWGNIPLNGTKYRLASDGCLVTAMAMVLTHYGHRSVTPSTINADPNNFASYYPAYLLYTIRADGATATRTKVSAIDAILKNGDPAIVGVKAYGGTHYVVLTSGSKGKYLMRDPYVANGKDINFTSHYSVGSIFHISKVIVSG